MLVGIAGADQELKVNPSQYLFGKTMKGSVFGGNKYSSGYDNHLNNIPAVERLFEVNYAFLTSVLG